MSTNMPLSGKRSATDIDPDYEDLAEHQAKRQRVIEENAQQATIGAISRIVRAQFKIEIDNKESEAKEADKRLKESRQMIDRLRAVIIASYFSKKQEEPEKDQNSLTAPPPSIHPTAKKYLGKAPMGTSIKQEQSEDPPSQAGQSSGPSSSAEKTDNGVHYSATLQLVKTSAPKPTASSVTAAAKPSSLSATSAEVTSSSSSTAISTSSTSTTSTTARQTTQGFGTTAESGSSRSTVKRTIIVGNSSRFILPSLRHAKNLSTHKWMVYVRGPRDNPDISDIVSKVWFLLHPSYRPLDLVEVKEPPFHLARLGWGEFPVRVQLHFRDPRNKRVDIIHNLKLDQTYTGLQTLGAETVVSVDLVRDHVPSISRPKLSAITAPSTDVIVEATIKHEPEESVDDTTQTTSHCQCEASKTGNHICRCHEKSETVPSRQMSPANGALDPTVTIKQEPPDDSYYSVSTHAAQTANEENPVIKKEVETESVVCKNENDIYSVCGRNAAEATVNSAVGKAASVDGSVMNGDTEGLNLKQVVTTVSDITTSVPASQHKSAVCSVSRTTASTTVSGLPHTAVHLSNHSKNTTVQQLPLEQSLSGFTRPLESSKGLGTSTPAVKVLLVKPTGLAGQNLRTGTSLLSGSRDQKVAAEKSAVARPVSLLKVTSQGLKPVMNPTPPKLLQNISTQPTGVRHPAVVRHGTNNLHTGHPTPVVTVKGENVAQSVQRNTGNSYLGQSTVSNSGNPCQPPVRFRSLLSTAAKPWVKSLLNKSGQSAAVSEISKTSVSSPPSSLPAVVNSLNSGDTYILAQINNKKVYMKVDSMKKDGVVGQKLGIQGSDVKGASGGNISGHVKCSMPAMVSTQNVLSSVSQNKPKVVMQMNPNHHTVKPNLGQKLGSSVSANITQQQHQEQKSQAAIELERARAATMAKHQNILSKAAAQLISLKSMQDNCKVETACHKPCSARWFSQGLGSSLNLEASQGTAGEQAETDSKDISDKSKDESGIEMEKKILVLKRVKPSNVDFSLTGTPVADLSVEEYSNMMALVKAAVMRHPLLAPVSEKTVHPYSAASLDQWTSWHSVKRNAAEWTRAFAVKKYLQRHLGSDASYRGEQLWSTKQIMQWCRMHGLSPNGPGGRLLSSPDPDSECSKADCINKKLVSPSDFDSLHASFPCADEKEAAKVKSDESSEVEVVAVEPPLKTQKIVKKESGYVGQDLGFQLLPNSQEAVFVQDTASQIGVRFSPAVLAPGVFASTAEDMVFAAAMEFASDLIHKACSFALSDTNKDSPGHTVTAREVFQAMKTVPTASFLCNQNCGILNPPSTDSAGS